MYVCVCVCVCVTRTGLEARQLAQLADTSASFFSPFPFLWPGPWAGQENSCQRNVCVDDKPFVCKLRGCHQPVQTKWLWASVDLCMDREPQVCWSQTDRQPKVFSNLYVFALAPSLHSFWSYFSTDLQWHVGHLPTWGVHLSVSYLFGFSYSSWGSQGRNT